MRRIINLNVNIFHQLYMILFGIIINSIFKVYVFYQFGSNLINLSCNICVNIEDEFVEFSRIKTKMIKYINIKG